MGIFRFSWGGVNVFLARLSHKSALTLDAYDEAVQRLLVLIPLPPGNACSACQCPRGACPSRAACRTPYQLAMDLFTPYAPARKSAT